MTTFAITADHESSFDSAWHIRRVLRGELLLRTDRRLVGLSCLRAGAESVFAQAVLELGGELRVILPARYYREALPAGHWPTFDALVMQATEVIRLNHIEPTPLAYLQASIWMLGTADRLLAVWNGRPSRHYGDPADMIAMARRRGLPITVIGPSASEASPDE